MSKLACVHCDCPITDGAYYGAGDGDGNRFAHKECYWRDRCRASEKRAAELENALRCLSFLHDRAKAVLDGILR